jgi:hypothetical protein
MPDRAARPLRRRLLFAVVACLLAGGMTLIALVAVDVYLHWRTQDIAGVNVWGYRGAPVPAKSRGERRLVMLGGSTAFGYGLPAHESIPAFLEEQLNAQQRGAFRVVNLGAPGQGAYGFQFDLADYDYLDYDAVLLYEGYNDLGSDGVPADVPQRKAPNYLLWRRESPVFRLTGYYPIFPLVFREKAMAMMHGGDLNAAYGGEQVVFRPTLATRASASALAAAASIGETLERQIGALSETPDATPSSDPACRPRWKQYCAAVHDAVRFARERDKRVLVITQPFVSDSHFEQQSDLAAMLAARFGGDAAVRHVDLGRTIDLRDRAIAYDGLHLVAEGNAKVAAHLVQPVLELLR